MQHDFILLDRSGSMQPLWVEALSSVNAYVKRLADDKVDTGVTLATFDTTQMGKGMSFEIIRDRITPPTWRPVSSDDATPRGWTPLSDAVGQIVNLAMAGGYDKVAIIVMTDGHENASTELSVLQAKARLDQCRAKNWQVVFLGANFDNVQQGAQYGNAAFSTAPIAQGNFAAATCDLAVSRSSYGNTGATMGFTDEEKERLAQK